MPSAVEFTLLVGATVINTGCILAIWAILRGHQSVFRLLIDSHKMLADLVRKNL